MKKLIAMIGAVATAFGLYATDPVTIENSFETALDGVSDGAFTAATPWAYSAEETIPVAEYADGEVTPYAESGAMARRDDEFTNSKGVNNGYLKLETGKETLDLAMGGNTFVDQLVKFTGFEEYQTNFVAGTKIAVWMTAIEQEGTPAKPAVGTPKILDEEGNEIDNPEYEAAIPASTDYVAAETNLYVSVGKVVAGEVATIKLKIDQDIDGNALPAFSTEKWYRLTIKTIGNIFTDDKTDPRAGFAIFIDGVQVSSSDDAAKGLIAGTLTGTANSLMAKGALFTSIAADATFEKVAYQGIGAIDDVIADVKGPLFAQTVNVDVEDFGIVGAKVVKVEQAGEEVLPDGTTYSLVPGDVIVYYAPNGAFVIKADPATVQWAVDNEGNASYKTEPTWKPIAAAVQVVNADQTVTNFYTEADLAVELTGLKTGDTATVLKSCAITQGEEEEMVTLYSFTKNTTIAVPEANVWNVFIANVDAENAGMLYDNVGVEAGKVVNVFFDEKIADDNVCTLAIFGEIAGDITADDNGIVYVNAEGSDGCTLSGTITAANIGVGGTVTFVGSAKIVSSATDLRVYVGDEPTFVADDAEVEVTGGDEGPWTAQIKGAVTETGFAIIIAGDDVTTTNYYDSLDEAIAAAGTVDEKLGQLPSVVTILEDATIDSQVVIAKDVTIDFNGKKITSTWVSETGAANRGAFLVQGAFTATFENGTYESTAIQAGALVTGGATLNVVNMDYTTVYRALYAKAGGTIVVDADSSIIVNNIAGKNENAIMGFDGANITINGYVEAADNAAIIGSGNAGAAFNLTINEDATVKCLNGEGIYWPNAGTLTVNGGTIEGSTFAIYAKSGTVDINGGTLKSTGTVEVPVAYNDGCKGSGNALLLETGSEQGGYANNLTFDISAGTFESAGAAVYNFVREGADPIAAGISGGKYKAPPATALIADGYELGTTPDEDGFYSVAQSIPEYDIAVVNAGGMATVTIDQTGKVTQGSTISGTISELATGFVPFVFVDGVKVEVAQDGTFTGTAANSAKVAVAYAKDSAWYMDPFVRNSFASGITEENVQAAGLDMVNDNVWFGLAPGASSEGFAQYGLTALAASFGGKINEIYSKHNIMVGNPREAVSRSGTVLPKYNAMLGANYYGANVTWVFPAGGPWGEAESDVNYSVPFTGLGDGENVKLCPLAANADSSIVYGMASDGKVLYKFSVVDDGAGKITALNKVQTWDLSDKLAKSSGRGLTVANFGGNDIVYIGMYDGKGILVVDTSKTAADAVAYAANGEFYSLFVTGVAEGTPHLTVVSPTDTFVFALATDGQLASATPIVSLANNTMLKYTNDGRIGAVAYDDESKAFYGRSSGSTILQTMVLEKKPANLIVRGQFVTDKTVEQPADITPAFGTAVEQTYTAPAGYQIDSVTVNGAAVAGFTAGSSYTFSSAALDAYTLVKMTISKAPFIILIGSDGTEKARYADFDEAFAAAVDGDTVKLLQDVELDKTLEITSFNGTFDLGGHELTAVDAGVEIVDKLRWLVEIRGSADATSVMTITNGTITIPAGHMMYVESYATVTIAQNTEIVEIATDANANAFRLYGKTSPHAGGVQEGTATLNVYGKLTRSGHEGGWTDQCLGNTVVNVYDGAELTFVDIGAFSGHAAYGFKMSGGNAAVNVYGGLINSKASPFYSYGSCIGAITIRGGEITYNSDGNVFGVLDTTTVSGLGEGCTAKFKKPTNVPKYVDEGYALVKDGDWYVVKQTYTVTLKNGEDVVDTQVVADGQFATNVVLAVEGFKGWTNENYTAAFDFENTEIKADITLFAWIEAAGPVYPQDLPEEFPADADQAVKDKYVAWATAYGVTDATGLSDAFLMNVDPKGTIPTLKIESIAVEGDTATIVVSAEGVNLETGINGVLYVDGTNELGAEWATTEVEIGSAAEFTDGKATFTVPNAKFMKAGVGFKAPAVEPVE